MWSCFRIFVSVDVEFSSDTSFVEVGVVGESKVAVDWRGVWNGEVLSAVSAGGIAVA